MSPFTPPVISGASRSPLAPSLRPLRVLLLEDEPASQLLVRAELEDEVVPMHLVVSSRLADGLAHLAGGQFDAVLTDLTLPDSTGIATFERLADAAPDIPLIVLTSLLDDQVAAHILRRGAQDYLQKSRLGPGALARIIRHAIERHGYARELTESEARVRAIYEASLDAVVVTDDEGIVRFANPAAGGMFNRTPEQLLGRLFGHPMAAGTVTEIDIIRADGAVGVAEMHVVNLPWRGAPAHLASLRDITDRVQAEEQRRSMETRLRNSHKLEAIGQLAAGIAHEINTPAHFIGHNLEFALASLTRLNELLGRVRIEGDQPADREAITLLSQEVTPALDDALTGIRRIGKIVEAMKEFSHPGGPGDQPATPTDLNHLIEGSLVVAQHEWKHVAHVETALDRDLPLVPLFAGEFNQVLLNLLVNAAHAIAAAHRGRGTITVSTRREGDHAVLRLADTGAGIPDKIRHRMFEPFFTTKEVGVGTGQGLAHAHAIITKRHGGEISFETETGRGTCFIIRLPLAPVTPIPLASHALRPAQATVR